MDLNTTWPQFGMFLVIISKSISKLLVKKSINRHQLNSKHTGLMNRYFGMSRKYDLKGSTVDRDASEKEAYKDLPTLKDNEFLKDGCRIYIGDEAKKRLVETLTADVKVK